MHSNIDKRNKVVILKVAECEEDFRCNAKQYVINMLSNARTLHIKNGCYHARCIAKYYDFDTLEAAEESGLEFLKCKNCFKEQYRGAEK